VIIRGTQECGNIGLELSEENFEILKLMRGEVVC